MGLIWTNYLIELQFNQSEISIADGVVPYSDSAQTWLMLFGAVLGSGIAVAILFSLRFITQELFERLFPAMIAIILALITGYFAAKYMMIYLPEEYHDGGNVQLYLTCTLVLLFGFIGISLGLTRASNWESMMSAVKQRQITTYGNPKLVDTSALIDGRLNEVVSAGFLEGTLIVPRFVLHELQHIADSSDVLRRSKGRRGLDVLKEIQEMTGNISVVIIDDDPKPADEVDSKIVALAQQFKAKVITTDYNLNKVAQIEGLDVLNINDLANALKPAALPDEHMEVKIVKEGKEPFQGVGYLEDGTMIVVDGGRGSIGKTVDVLVTSVLQTAAGRMIFTKIAEPNQAETA
jgi:uncharacterized protein YacL